MDDWIKNIPKLDLHRHLTANITNDFLKNLTEKYGGQTTTFDHNEVSNNNIFPSSREFFSYHSFVRSHMRELSDFQELAKSIASQLEADNVIYSELLFSPQFYLQRGFSFDDIIDTLHKEFKTSSPNIKLLIEFSRARDQISASKTFSAITSYADSNDNDFIKGISIGGDEVNFKAYPFKKIFQKAREKGLQTTAHAGEWVGPESVWEVVKELGVNRIIHGITSIKDDKLVTYLKNNDIPLDISVSSNYSTGAVSKNDIHPIKFLQNKGVKLLVSTDIPGYLNITQSSELEKLLEMGFSKQDIFDIIINTIHSSFALDHEKENMLLQLKKYCDSNVN